ncbi:MAG: MFS transporter [Dehalococcoidia bacterium]|nr:MFS transporter [Dehalococcoidia bacterium]
MRSRPFIVLYVAVFVATFGISLVSPLLPVYAENLGATGVWIGFTFASFAITHSISGPLIGRLSDRYQRKPFIILGLLCYLAAALGYLTADSFAQIIAFRMLSGVGTGLIFSVARAYIGEMVPSGYEGRWFGVFATADIIGFGSGPMFAGLIRGWLGFDAVFIAMALIMGASTLIIMILLPPRPPQALNTNQKALFQTNASIWNALKDRLTVALTFRHVLFSFSWGSTLAFLAVRLENELLIGPVAIGLAFGVQNFASGISQPMLGWLTDHMNRVILVAVGLVFAGGCVVAVGTVGNLPLVLVFMILLGASGAMTQVAASALEIVAGRRVGLGTVIGLGSSGGGVGILCGAVLGGYLVDLFDTSAAFLFAGAVMIFGTPLFLLLVKGQSTKSESGVI